MQVAIKRVEGFAKEFGEAHRHLARLAAFPLVLTPDLLYQIWANFVPEAPWSAVAMVLLSRLCREVGYEIYQMDNCDRNLLLRELKQEFGQKILDELGEFLLDYVAQQLIGDDPDTEDLQEAQEWTALAYTKPNQAAQELALALKEKVKNEDMGEVLRLASLVETLAEPLVDAGFEPLLVYIRGMINYVRGNREMAANQFRKLHVKGSQVKIAGVTLDIPLNNVQRRDFQVAGVLPPDAPSYVTRQGDIDIYEGLKAGEFCYIFNSRQMGKSSLIVRTGPKLRSDGFACILIDMSNLGTQMTQDQWYATLIDKIAKSCAINFNLSTWWKAHSLLSPILRLGKFIEEVLLVQIKQPIVIFIDEVDSILFLKFSTDDFFAFIRYCYNQRANNPEYRRLTFCLVGVVTPSQLIQDKKRTPFNIGRAIELNGFKLDEVAPLAQGLAGKVDNPQTVLREILDWTGRQPFLTQKICSLIAKSKFPIHAGSEAERVEEIVRSHIINNWESQDSPEHLQTIRDRIFWIQQSSVKLLRLYQQILQEGEIRGDNSREQIELLLSGLVVQQDGSLRVYNRIYEAVFNQAWIEKEAAKLRELNIDPDTI